MKKILVTGCTGFVGKNLLPYLNERGFDITGVVRHIEESIGQITYNQLNHIRDYDALIHLAGKAHDLKNTADDKVYYDVNTDLTAQVFDSFLASNATVFIFISSVKAAADSVEGVLDETAAPDPKTVYGLSKQKAEQYILSNPIPQGKRVYIIRPCMIHGPGNKGNLNLLYQLVKKGVPYPLAAFENKRSLLSITNLLFAIHALLSQPGIESGIYHIADDEPLATTEITAVLAQAINKKPSNIAINKNFVKTLAAVGDKLRLPLNSERLQKLTESYVVSNQKIKDALGIKAFPVSAREGLLYTAKNL